MLQVLLDPNHMIAFFFPLTWEGLCFQHKHVVQLEHFDSIFLVCLHLEYWKRNVFCDKTCRFKRGKKEHLGSSEHENAEINIKDAAKKLDDYVILAKFGDINFVSKEVKFLQKGIYQQSR